MRTFILFIFSIMVSINIQSQDKPKLIYVGDPMCSWCYGISPEWQKLEAKYDDKFNIEYVMGGLRPYYKKPISDMKEFLSEHWTHVNQASGQEFNYGILERSDLNYDTEPPSRAVVVIRELKREIIGSFFVDIQKLFYFENKDMSKSESYHQLLDKYDVDVASFDELFDSSAIKETTKSEFDKAQLLGVSSFPTILLEINGERHIVAQGYSTSKEMSSAISNLLSDDDAP